MSTDTSHLVTDRLQLRPPTRADAGLIAVYAGDFDIARMTSRIPYPYGIGDAEEWLDAVLADGCAFAIEREGQFIGCCGVAAVDQDTAEIGYWIARPWWGQGYATEAVTALVRLGFRRLRYRRLVAARLFDNPLSARVLEKTGFRETGHMSCWCAARRSMVPAITYVQDRPSFATRARHWLQELAP